MTRYWILFWTFCFLITRAARQKGWNSITVRPAVKLQDIQVIGFNEHIGFHANETWVHVRSSELQLGLREKQCVEARFRVEGKRTRSVQISVIFYFFLDREVFWVNIERIRK